MTRKEFLSLIGFSTAGVAVAACVSGCAKNVNGATNAPTNVDFCAGSKSASQCGLTNEWRFHVQ